MTAPFASTPRAAYTPSTPRSPGLRRQPVARESFARPLLRLRRPRLLLVGDPGNLRGVIERTARQVDSDAVIDWAPSASEARRMLRAIAYDAVVSDPGTSRDASGLVLRAWCRRLQPKARFGVLSSLSVRELVGTEPGCPALPRPFSTDQLRGFLERLIQD